MESSVNLSSYGNGAIAIFFYAIGSQRGRKINKGLTAVSLWTRPWVLIS